MSLKSALLTFCILCSINAKASQDYLACNFSVEGLNEDGRMVEVAGYFDKVAIEDNKAFLELGQEGMKLYGEYSAPGYFSLVFAPSKEFGSGFSLILLPEVLKEKYFSFSQLLQGNVENKQLKHMVGSCVVTDLPPFSPAL